MALTRRVMRSGKVPQGLRSASVHLPAPTGGINTVSAASAMPASDCLYLYNMIPYQYGLRVRSGWREWATGMNPHTYSTGLYDYGSPLMFHLSAPLGGAQVGQWTQGNPVGVRTILPFNGSNANGLSDRLWAVSDEGIWDVTSSTTSPTNVNAFSYVGLPDGPRDAGRGIGTSFVNSSGDHYYLYCDGFHGYLRYSEKAGAWTAMTGLTYANRASATGTQLYWANDTYEAMYGPLDPSKFRFVMQWKSRLWFAMEGSATAVYLDIGAFAGPVYPMPFANRFKSGGELVGLWAWTVDGGTGIDDHLVAISRGGDLVIYSGTDPSLPGAFLLRGVWWVGNPPPGRRCASAFGGDLFILTVLGCVPLSKLVAGGLIRDPDIMSSFKVSNIFNRLMTERGALQGWSLELHPTDNLMVVSVPPTPADTGLQLTMSLANQGWSLHTGVPMQCMATWRNKLFFGTFDGRVCVNDGEVDELKIGSTSVRPIEWALLTSYHNLGSANKKRVHMIKPHFMTDGTSPGVSVGARFDFDIAQADLPLGFPLATPTAWDTGVWDTGVWDDSIGVHGRYGGSTGIGTHVALAMRGTSVTNTTFVGFDVVVEQGGIL